MEFYKHRGNYALIEWPDLLLAGFLAGLSEMWHTQATSQPPKALKCNLSPFGDKNYGICFIKVSAMFPFWIETKIYLVPGNFFFMINKEKIIFFCIFQFCVLVFCVLSSLCPSFFVDLYKSLSSFISFFILFYCGSSPSALNHLEDSFLVFIISYICLYLVLLVFFQNVCCFVCTYIYLVM